MSALLALKATVESQQTQLAAMQQKIDELNARINGVAFAVPPGVSAGQKLQLQVPGIGMVAPEMPAEVVAGQQIRITFPAKPVLVPWEMVLLPYFRHGAARSSLSERVGRYHALWRSITGRLAY